MTSPNPDSILDSIKKTLGIDPDYEAFDLDVIMHINNAFSTLREVGVGSTDGFVITDNTTTWNNFSDNMIFLASVKSYVYLKVKLIFDPPPTSFAIKAVQDQIEELVWRLNVIGETITPPSDPFGNPPEPSTGPIDLMFESVVTPNASQGSIFYLTMTGDCTINAPVHGTDGQHITLEIKSNGHSVTWNSRWDFGDAGDPILSSGGESDIISSYYKRSVDSWRAGSASGF